MLLLIDAGNTRVKWGVPEPAWPTLTAAALRWRQLGAVERDAVAQLSATWQGLPISRVHISNVAGAGLRAALSSAVQAAFGPAMAIDWFAAVPELAGVRNGYRDPAQLGCDRFASLIGAHALYPGQALIVATCGTATTVDALTAEGHFLGGMILPGTALMACALARNTAQLPQIEPGLAASSPFADHTAAAIAAGCLAAQAGAIERAVMAHRAQHGVVLCVLAGGDAAQLAPQLAVSCVTVDHLVLIGLHVAATQRDSHCSH